MPSEQVNYTISNINGTLWATIDGDYPIYILNQNGGGYSGELPMVYPMPPSTTNIHLYLGDRELSWTNYTQAYPDQLHHTAIGDWWMIYSVIGPVSNYFELKIHYQHPLQMVNGSYLFLYDLNISPYLSSQGSNSTCHYTIRMETNATNLHAYTTETDTQWNPINYTVTQEGSTQIISVEEQSTYSEMPGDFLFEFNSASQVPELQFWAIAALFLVTSVAMLIFLKRQRLQRC